MNTSATSISSPFSYQKHTTRDSDQHAESLAQWNQTYNQLSAGPFASSLVDMWFDGMQVFRGRPTVRFPRPGRRGRTPTSSAFRWPPAAADCSPSRRCRRTPVLLSQQRGFALRTPNPSISSASPCPKAALDDFLNLGSESEVQRIWAGRPSCWYRPRKTRQIAHLPQRHVRSQPFRTGPARLPPDSAGHALGHHGPSGRVLQSASRAPTPPLLSKGRCHVVEQAIDYAMAHLDQAVTVSDLCNRVNVSRRMLNYCFLDVLRNQPDTVFAGPAPERRAPRTAGRIDARPEHPRRRMPLGLLALFPLRRRIPDPVRRTTLGDGPPHPAAPDTHSLSNRGAEISADRAAARQDKVGKDRFASPVGMGCRLSGRR